MMNLNDKIFFDLYGLTHKSVLFDNMTIFLAQYFPFLVIIFAIIFLLFHHEILIPKNKLKSLTQKWKEIFFFFLSVFLAWISSLFLKIIFHVPRPFVEFSNIVPLLNPKDFSFPSGHATFFMAIAVAIFLYHKKIGYLFLIFAIIIGISRVIIGVHFPLDILTGWILGGFISFILIKIFKNI